MRRAALFHFYADQVILQRRELCPYPGEGMQRPVYAFPLREAVHNRDDVVVFFGWPHNVLLNAGCKEVVENLRLAPVLARQLFEGVDRVSHQVLGFVQHDGVHDQAHQAEHIGLCPKYLAGNVVYAHNGRDTALQGRPRILIAPEGINYIRRVLAHHVR